MNEFHRYEASAYLQRPTEALIISGYRGWMSEIALCKPCGLPASSKLEAVRQAHFSLLGMRGGDHATNALQLLFTTLGECANCSLTYNVSHDSNLCRDECLFLSLIASIQHGDEVVTRISAESFTCPLKAIRLISTASEYAFTLKAYGASTIPVPYAAIRQIADAPSLAAGIAASTMLQ